MKKAKVIAYVVTKNMKLMTKEDIEILDGIHIAFGLIRNGEVYWDKLDATEQIKRIRSINPDMKIVLSIGGWGADGFSQAAASKEGREKFAKTAIDILKEENLDGLDIDWEYPCIDDGGIVAMPEDKENFTLMLKELREQLNDFSEYKSLSIAAGGLESYIHATNMGEVHTYLDYVQLMTYDFHGGFSKITGHLANLYGNSIEPDAPNANHTIGMFLKAGVPMDKIVMGAAFYGREWRGVPDVNNGIAQKAGAVGDFFRGYDEVEETLANGKEGFKRFWDEEAKSVYVYNGDAWISYEDKEALKYKAEYVLDKGMYGIMYWEYAQDASYTLTKYLQECLNK